MSKTATEIRLLTPDEVATALSVARTTVCKMLRTGELHGVKIGSQWRVHPRTVEEIVESKCNACRP